MWQDLLIKLTPYKQHLVTWSACVEFENCEQNGSLAYLCRALLTYEGGMQIVYAKHKKNYDADWRDQSYFTRHSKCKTEFPSVAARVSDGIEATLKGLAN